MKNKLPSLSIKILIATVVYLFIMATSYASEVYMEPGESQAIQVQDNIDAVFISSPDIADYEIVGEHSVIIYARAQGRADLVIFDKNGKQITKSKLIVDELLSGIQKKISQISPDSQVSIEKMGKSYVLSGTASSEEERDKIYQIVGEGVGATREVSKKEVANLGDDNQDNKNENPWLEGYTYQGVINKLIIPSTNQVNVKLSVVEVTKSFTDNVGIDWSTTSSTPGTFRFIRFNADTLTSLVHAISNDSVARVLAEPNLSVMSGETAEFLVGGEVPVVTSSANNGTNVQYKEFGIKLNIGAKVSNSKRIRITLGEEVSNIDESYSTKSGDNFPALQMRRARTTVELADGESFLLGGLISNNEREALSRIPFIGDVPILGALFRNAETARSRRELMVVATVNLVKPIGQYNVVMPDFQRTSTWARFFNLDGIMSHIDRRSAEGFIDQGGFIR